jgi:hypothetical protein
MGRIIEFTFEEQIQDIKVQEVICRAMSGTILRFWLTSLHLPLHVGEHRTERDPGVSEYWAR